MSVHQVKSSLASWVTDAEGRNTHWWVAAKFTMPSPPRPGAPSPGRQASSMSRVVSVLGLNRAEKLQLLGERSPLGAYLSPAELNRLSKVCSIVRFSEGKPIRANSPFYLVVDGVVAVMDDDEVTQRTSVPLHPARFHIGLALSRAPASRITR